jgi:cyanophycinase-like exopeptidase
MRLFMFPMADLERVNPGPVVFFGSGETSPSGRRIFESIFGRLKQAPRVTLLETPAGFELNSPAVAGRVADFLRYRLQNYAPQTEVIPARKRGTEYSPDNPEILKPLLKSDLIFMGPGSPTYAVRQLRGSLAWDYLVARHRLGAALALASAATIAVGAYALPVYEIYKVGEELHWKPGLDLFAPYGISLVFVPHWNNYDGGKDLDTSRCFMGRARFEPLLEMLPAGHTVVGIDEHTGLLVDLVAGQCEVLGLGNVTVLKDGEKAVFSTGICPLIDILGLCRIPEPGEGLPQEVLETVIAAESTTEDKDHEEELPPLEVLALVEQRAQARNQQDWTAADALRERIKGMGWLVEDTVNGPVVRFDRENLSTARG